MIYFDCDFCLARRRWFFFWPLPGRLSSVSDFPVHMYKHIHTPLPPDNGDCGCLLSEFCLRFDDWLPFLTSFGLSRYYLVNLSFLFSLFFCLGSGAIAQPIDWLTGIPASTVIIPLTISADPRVSWSSFFYFNFRDILSGVYSISSLTDRRFRIKPERICFVSRGVNWDLATCH